jgi:hypothetical protein
MSDWRVWLAFEVRPGITSTSVQDKSEHWRGLAEARRVEFDRWLTCLLIMRTVGHA